MKQVFITAYESLSSLGIGVQESVRNLRSGNQDLIFPGQNDPFKRPYFKINQSFDQFKDKNRCSQLVLLLLKKIQQDYRIDFNNVSLFFGTSTGGIRETENQFIDMLHHKTEYPLFNRHFFDSVYNDIIDEFGAVFSDYCTFSTACSSSGHSIMQAYRFLREGIINKAIVIGADVLCHTTMVGFDSLKLVSESGTKPLTQSRDGLSLGEGAGVLLLENDPQSEVFAEIIGASTTSDGYHISSPNPEGTQQKICMEKALKEGNCSINDIDYINAHGTGTLMNDEIEMKIIQSLFPDGVLVSSTKAFIGHTLGASSVTEIAIVLEMLKEKKVFQVKGLGESMNKKYIPEDHMDVDVKYWMKNSFGFGGNNVSLVLKNNF